MFDGKGGESKDGFDSRIVDDDDNENGHLHAEKEEENRDQMPWSDRRIQKILIGTSLAWFCLDVAYYGLQLNQTIVLHAIGYVRDDVSAYEKIKDNVIGNLILSICGTFPGKKERPISMGFSFRSNEIYFPRILVRGLLY